MLRLFRTLRPTTLSRVSTLGRFRYASSITEPLLSHDAKFLLNATTEQLSQKSATELVEMCKAVVDGPLAEAKTGTTDQELRQTIDALLVRVFAALEIAAEHNIEALKYLGNFYRLGLPACGIEPNHTLAFRYYMQAAAAGDAEAQLLVAMMYEYGEAPDFSKPEPETIQALDNTEEFVQRLDPKTGQNVFVSKLSLEKEKAREREREKIAQMPHTPKGLTDEVMQINLKENKKRAVKWLERAAEQNHPIALLHLAQRYVEGSAVDTNLNRARELLEAAVEQQNTDALYMLAQMYYTGMRAGTEQSCNYQVIEQNIPKAMQLFESAAALGDPNAQFFLGHSYHQGQHVERNVKRGIELLQQALAKNHPGANFYWALMHRPATGSETPARDSADVPESYVTYREYLQRAVDMGYGPALQVIADMYFHGSPEDGIQRDYKTAFAYYRKAAATNHPESLVCLGVMYYQGLGTEQKDYVTAFKLYDAAAMQGNQRALLYMADMLQKGIGTPKDEKKARHLLQLYQQLTNAEAQ